MLAVGRDNEQVADIRSMASLLSVARRAARASARLALFRERYSAPAASTVAAPAISAQSTSVPILHPSSQIQR